MQDCCFKDQGGSVKHKIKVGWFLLAMLLLCAPLPGSAGVGYFEFWDQKCAKPENRETVRCLVHRAHSLMLKHSHDQDKMKQAISLYKQALAQDPWNDSAMNGLSTAYQWTKDYPNALKTLNCFISRRPWSLEMRLFRCQLLEGMGLPQEESKRCFGEVARQYRETGRTGANYVLAVLLADDPQAAAIKREFHKQAKPGTPDGYLWQTIIKDFDRDAFIKGLVKEGYKQGPLPREISPADCAGIIPGPTQGRAMSPVDRATAKRKEAKYHKNIRRQQVLHRAQVYLAQKNYVRALAIIEAEPAVKSQANTLLLWKCLLREKIGRPERQYKTCYRQYLAAMEKDDFHVANSDYVRIGILAYWPDKKSIREKVIVNFMPGTRAQKNWDQYLDIMRREDVFRQMLKW